MSSFDHARSQTIRHSTNPPAPARPQADLSPVQALGNQLMQSMQPKLEVSAPNDTYEQEADNFASQVTSVAPAQRESKEPEKKRDDKAAQQKPLAAQATPLVQRAAKADDKRKADATAPKGGKEPEKKKDDKTAQKMSVQRGVAELAPEDESSVQTKRKHSAQLDDEKKKDDKAAQTAALQRAAEASTTTADPRVEQDVERQKQSGRPLSSAERQYFEPRFGADFSSIRVHDDAKAARAASDLNAKAFTQGSHIFFGSGYHQSNDTPGRQLMAHELTHTLQQGAARPAAPAAPAAHAPATAPAQRQAQAPTQAAPVEAAPTGLIQRQTGTTATTPGGGGGSTGSSTTPDAANTDPTTDATQFDKSKGQLDKTTPPTTITFDKIKIPSFKNAKHRKSTYSTWDKLRRTKNFKRGSPNQRDKWRSAMQPSVRSVVDQKREKNTDPKASNYVFEVKVGSKHYYYFGTLDDIARELTTPSWGGVRSPVYRRMEVDHIVELQLADWPARADANDPQKNMELLNREENGASGDTIKKNIIAKLDKFVTDTKGRYGQSAEELKEKFNVDFEGVDPASGSGDISTSLYWTRDAISQGKHLSKLRPSNRSELGGSGNVLVFGGSAGGRPQEFRWPGKLLYHERHWLKPFEITGKKFDTKDDNAENSTNLGTLTVNVPANDREWKFDGGPQTIDVTRVPGQRYAGFINKGAVKQNLYKLRVKKMSPIEITSFEIDDNGIEVAGVITSDLPLIRGAKIDFQLISGELTLSKTFSTTDFTLPAPINVTNSALTFTIGTKSGLKVSGQVDFGITNVGQGYIKAGAGTSTSISLQGHFDFDPNLFKPPARITMRYKDDKFSGEGDLGIPSGKIKGIRSAQIHMEYKDETFTAKGTVEPSIPGVQQGTMGVVYSKTDGLVISGSLQLAENPAIRSGSIEASVQRKPDGTYKVYATGKAQPKVPGLDSELNVTYDDGAFDMSVTAAFSRGMLKGQMTAAATNRAVNPDTGQPAGEPTEKITVYGGGSVTIRFAPWLQGTAGIKLLPNGEIEMNGSIGLPNTVTIFDAKRFDRNIFHINIDIPIVGVSVLGHNIGIFATIGGGLDLKAGIGPGQLQNLNLGVTYNPSHEDQTHITGHGEFVIPADAGLKLSIHGGIGAGIPIVSAEAGIEVSGELGLVGEARAGVDVDWTPQRGVVLDAQGSIFVEPRLKLDLNAYVSVTADLVFHTVDLYSHRWRLAGTEIGSNLRFGVTFPIHYEENKPFTLSTDDVHFVIPEIDPKSILSSIL